MDKTQAISLAPAGWVFVGIVKDQLNQTFYAYQKGSYRTGFKVMLLLECDMQPSNIEVMVKYCMSRVLDHDYSQYA